MALQGTQRPGTRVTRRLVPDPADALIVRVEPVTDVPPVEPLEPVFDEPPEPRPDPPPDCAKPGLATTRIAAAVNVEIFD